MKYLFVSVFLLGLLAGCRNSRTAEPAIRDPQPVVTEQQVTPVQPVAPSTITSVLPAFRMLGSNNQVVDLTQFKGKKVFVNLWATWCPPCRAEIPSIERLAAKTDRSKAEFVMLSLDDNFEKARSFAVKNNMKLPVYYPAGNLPALFEVDGIPVTFIFNEKGEIIYQQTGAANYDSMKFLNMLNN
jgi:thiol-disulfide isomerase/thioredoxin